jgi:hypothetical protein
VLRRLAPVLFGRRWPGPCCGGEKVSAEALEQMRWASTTGSPPIVNLIDDDRVYLPFTVVHAERVD